MPVVMNEPETSPQWIKVPYDHSLPYLWACVVDQENGCGLKAAFGIPIFPQ